MSKKRQYHRKRNPVAGEPFSYIIRIQDSGGATYSAPDWLLSLEVTTGGKVELIPMVEMVVSGQVGKAWQLVLPGEWTAKNNGYTLQFRVQRKHVATLQCYYDVAETVLIQKAVAASSTGSADILTVTIDQTTEVTQVTVDTVVLPLYEDVLGIVESVSLVGQAAATAALSAALAEEKAGQAQAMLDATQVLKNQADQRATDAEYWAGLSEQVALPDSVITSPKLADSAVTPQKASFLVPGKNLFDKTATNNTDGYYLDNANTAVASGIYAYTDYMAVTPGLAYIGKGASNYIRYTTYFDANRQVVAGGSNSNVSTFFTIPAGVRYVRVTYWLADKASFQFEQSTFATQYEDFQRQLPAEIPARAVAAAAVTTPSLAPAAVTPDKTSFIVLGRNLFDVSAAGNEIGKYIESNGAIFANAGFNLTYLIPVQPNTWYYPSVKNRLGFFNSAGAFISGETHTRTNQQFQTPANTAYVRLSVPVAGWDSFQLETGTTANAWEKYGRKLTGIGVSGVEPESTTFLTAGKNLFNLADAGNVPLNYINSVNGTLVSHASYAASHFIPVVAGEWYYPSFKNQLAFYNAGKVYLSGLTAGRTDQQFQAPAGASYVRLTMDTISTFQLEKGMTKTAYERFAYLAKSADGRPVAPSYLPGEIIGPAIDLYQEPCILAIAPKLYVPVGKEIAVYSENIHKNFLPYRDRTDVVITGGKKTGRGGKLTPVSAATINGTVTVGNKTFDALTSKSFQVIATSATLTTALKVLNLGDSYTLRSTFVNALVAGAGTNVTFLGIRNSTQAPGIRCEGRGGWAVTGGIGYTTHNTTLYNPFVQPTTTYLYLGNTGYWKAVLGAGGYDYDGIATPIKSQFNAATGYANAPRTNDLMYDNTLAAYKAWDGSAWQTVTAPSFAFHFGKYRQCWGIDAPNVVHIMLGTNDFTNATESQFAGLYVPYKAGYDAMITSIKADTPTVKIIVGVPVSSGRQGEFGTLESERKKRTYWLLAEKLIADYAGREAESIIVNDYHSGTDRVHGYDITDDKPYADYPGADTEPYLADIIHIGNTRGFVQMGNQYYGLIQYLRGL